MTSKESLCPVFSFLSCAGKVHPCRLFHIDFLPFHRATLSSGSLLCAIILKAQLKTPIENRRCRHFFYFHLSHYVVVIRWITSCHKNRITTRVITLWRECVTSLTTSMSTMCFLIETIFILKAIKSHFKGSCDKQNLTLVVISYENYETRRRLVS